MKALRSIVAILILAAGGCDASGPPIRFIVPNGFKGKFDIIQDPKSGVVLTNRGGTLTCVVPPTGQLHVRSLKPFGKWHSETASYADGTALLLQADTSLPQADTSSISLFSLGSFASGSTQGVSYLVGTSAEFRAFRY